MSLKQILTPDPLPPGYANDYNITVKDLTVLETTTLLGTVILDDLKINNDLEVDNNAQVVGTLEVNGSIDGKTASAVLNTLEVKTAFKFDPAPTNGYVLTSNATGVASWQPAPVTPAVTYQTLFTRYVVDNSVAPPVGSYPTIQSAINDVALNEGGLATLVLIMPGAGSYTENLTFPLNINVILQGVSDVDNTNPVVLFGGLTVDANCSVTLENIQLLDDGVNTPILVGDPVFFPSLYIKNCKITALTVGFSAVLVGKNAFVAISNTQITSFSANGVASNTDSESSIIVLDSCLVSGALTALNIVSGLGSTTVSLTSCRFFSSSATQTIITTDSVFITSKLNHYINSGGEEDIFLDATSTLITTFDTYNSFSVSTFVVTGNVGGTVNYALSVNTSTSSGFNPVLTLNAYTVV